MGEVWAATDTLLDRRVAVKLLRRDLAADPVLRARFETEARHTASLQHPNVASVLDYGDLPDEGPDGAPVPFLVMELVDGRPLSELITPGKPMRPERAADLVAQAAEGIGAAHRIGIVHRDVKPGNILVSEDGRVKVTDFGVARASDSAPLTMTGHLVGTPAYLAPEQAEGAPAVPASDVYALGIVLYECLTGQKPFAGESPVVTALMQIRDPLPPLPESVPAPLREVVSVATRKDPDRRFATAGALAAALQGESAATHTAVLRAAPRARSHAAPRRRSALAAVAAVVALLVVIALGWLAFGRDGSSPSQTRTPAPSPTQSPVAQVLVRPVSYVGLSRQDAAAGLRARGLRVTSVTQSNPGGHPANTVASLSPSAQLIQGAVVTLHVWGAPPPPPQPTHPNNGNHGNKGPKQNSGNGGSSSGQGNNGGGKGGAR
jgi:serine/threonine-protein kinase